MGSRIHILTMTIPIPPSANHSFGISRNGRYYRTAKAKEFLATIEKKVEKALPADWDSETVELEHDEWIIIELHHFDGAKEPMVGKRGGSDLSNRHPLIHNGIKHKLGIDDYNFFTRDMSREKSYDNPRIVVSLYREKIDVVRVRGRRSDR